MPRGTLHGAVRLRTAPHASVKTAAHYKTTNHPPTTSTAPLATWDTRTFPYYISGTTPGFKVMVDVTTRNGVKVTA
jgi:hypothetical protein